MIGKTVSHYKIIRELGAGGMGVVYEAVDTKLGRTVALKFLPPESTRDPEAKARFVNEAKAVSALDHPNVCTLYEVDETDSGQMFLAMAAYSGENLKDRIAKGPLPIEEALDISRQITEGLVKAHAGGIVHRDIKPANIIFTEDGLVKILDFGLAKLAGQTRVTRTGTTLGTTAYMSPEQAGGQNVDERSDLWSVGVVLFEMISGQVPFPGEHNPAVIYSIMNSKPLKLNSLRTEVPKELEWTVDRCLVKEADSRYSTANELLIDLRQMMGLSDSRIAPPPGSKSIVLGRRHFGLAAILTVAVIVLGVFLWPSSSHKSSPGLTVFKQTRLTSNTEENPVYFALISPDGKYLAYVDQSGLSLKVMESGEIKPIAKLEGEEDVVPAGWYPDNLHLLLSIETKDDQVALWKHSIITGSRQKIRDAARSFFTVPGGAVSPDGSKIAYLTSEDEFQNIWLMDQDGTNPRQVVTCDPETELLSLWVRWAPDSHGFIYRRLTEDSDGYKNQIETYNLIDGTQEVVLEPTMHVFPGIHAVWDRPDRILFSKTEPTSELRGNNLWSIELDLQTGKRIGEPRRLTSWTGFFHFLMSRTNDGSILTIKWMGNPEIFITHLELKDKKPSTIRRLTHDSMYDFFGSWLPGNGSLIFESDRRGSNDLYVLDINTGKVDPLVVGPQSYGFECLGPGADFLYYRAFDGSASMATREPRSLMRMDLTGGPAAHVATLGAETEVFCSRESDGWCVLIESGNDETTIHEFNEATGKGRLLGTLDPELRYWSLSPNATMVGWTDEVEGGGPRLNLLNLETGKTSNVAVPGLETLGFLSWWPDGNSLVGMTKNPDRIIRVRLDGSWEEFAFSEGEIPFNSVLHPSPEGNHLAFVRSLRQSSVWLLQEQ